MNYGWSFPVDTSALPHLLRPIYVDFVLGTAIHVLPPRVRFLLRHTHSRRRRRRVTQDFAGTSQPQHQQDESSSHFTIRLPT